MMCKNRYERRSDATYAYRRACVAHPELNIAGCLSFTEKIGPKEHVKTFNLPLESRNMTAAALFRTLHECGVTLLLDEAERLRESAPESGELR